MAATDTPAARHRPGLDGLRGIAVVAVVAYHLGYLPGGFLGVDVFFVLSGYLIAGLILDEARRDGSVSLRGFWGRRIRRLVPALLFMVSTVVLVALAMGWPAYQRRALGIDATATLTWWGNWRQAGGASYWDSGQSLFRHGWSLGIEEQFYVLWPLVVLVVLALVRRFRWPLAATLGIVALLAAIASGTWMAVLSSRLADADLTRAYVGTDTRVMAALAGCALAAAVAARPTWFRGRAWVRATGFVGAATILAAFVVIEVTEPALYRRGGFALVTVAACLTVLAAADATLTSRDPLGWIVTRAPARYLGLRSYAIYLWSWPIQVLLVFRWPAIPSSTLALVTVTLTMALAELSHRWVEAPLRHRSGWAMAPRRRRPAWALGAMASFLVVALAFASAVPPTPEQRMDTAESAAEALRPADPASGERPGVDVLIIGDSVAWRVGAYRPPDDALPDGIASVTSRAIIGCGLLASKGWAYRQVNNDGVFALPNKICASQVDALQLGLEASPDVVLTMPGAWEWADMRRPDGTIIEAQSDEMAGYITDDLVAMIGAAHAAGARFVVTEWACPGPKSAPVRRDDSFIRWINRTLAAAVAEGVATYGADATFLEATDEICTDGDPTAEPTEARAEATDDEFHVAGPEGGQWTWDRWLTPALVT